jgi:hypothetical protein
LLLATPFTVAQRDYVDGYCKRPTALAAIACRSPKSIWQTCVRRTTVTLLAQELQRGGAIRYSRGRITILDRKKLEAGVCECYDAIKHENLSLKLGVKMPSEGVQDDRNANVLFPLARR